MFVKKNTSEGLISLDINENYISVLETSIKSGKKHVENFNVTDCPSGIFLGNTITNLDHLMVVLGKLLSGLNFKNKKKETILAIPEDLTISQIFTVDRKLTDYDIENYIVANFDKYVTQLDYENCYIDFQEIELNRKDNTKKDVLLVVVKKEEIDKLEEAIISIGLTPKSIDLKTYALERMVQFHKSKKEEDLIAYIDVQKEKTEVYFFKDGKKLYSDLNNDFSINTLEGKKKKDSDNKKEDSSVEEKETVVISKKEESSDIDIDLDLDLDLDSEIEEEIKEEVKKEIEEEAEKVDKSIENIKNNQDFYDFLENQLNLFYTISDEAYKVDKIVVSGDVDKFNLDTILLSEDLNIKLIIAQPFSKMTFASRVNKDRLLSHAPNLGVLVGLSIPKDENDISINLHDWRSELRITKNKSFQNTLGSYVFVCLGLLVAGHFYYDVQITQQESRNSVIQSVIDADIQREIEIKDYEFKKENIVNRIATINSLQVERPKIVNILTDIVNSVPKEIYLTKLTRSEKNQITIKGTALQDSKVFALIRNLEQSKWLYDVKISNINSVDDSSKDDNQYIENVRYEFEIQMMEEEMSKLNKDEEKQ